MSMFAIREGSEVRRTSKQEVDQERRSRIARSIMHRSSAMGLNAETPEEAAAVAELRTIIQRSQQKGN